MLLKLVEFSVMGYRNFSDKFTVNFRGPMNKGVTALKGFSGSGKTNFARALFDVQTPFLDDIEYIGDDLYPRAVPGNSASWGSRFSFFEYVFEDGFSSNLIFYRYMKDYCGTVVWEELSYGSMFPAFGGDLSPHIIFRGYHKHALDRGSEVPSEPIKGYVNIDGFSVTPKLLRTKKERDAFKATAHNIYPTYLKYFFDQITAWTKMKSLQGRCNGIPDDILYTYDIVLTVRGFRYRDFKQVPESVQYIPGKTRSDIPFIDVLKETAFHFREAGLPYNLEEDDDNPPTIFRSCADGFHLGVRDIKGPSSLEAPPLHSFDGESSDAEQIFLSFLWDFIIGKPSYSLLFIDNFDAIQHPRIRKYIAELLFGDGVNRFGVPKEHPVAFTTSSDFPEIAPTEGPPKVINVDADFYKTSLL